MLLIVTPQKLHQIPIGYLCLPIFFWMDTVDLFNLVSIFSHNVVQNSLRNIVSIYEMMLLGIPKCTHTYSKNKFVSSYSLIVFLQGMRMHIFVGLYGPDPGSEELISQTNLAATGPFDNSPRSAD